MTTSPLISEQNVQSGLRLAVAEGTINDQQAHRVAYLVWPALARPKVAREQGVPAPIAEVAAYAGAALVVGGIWMLVRDGWHQLTQPGRIAVAVLMTLLLSAAAATVGAPFRERVVDAAQARLASTAAALASMSAALIVGVCTPGYFPAALTLSAVSAAAYVLFRGFPLVLTCWFGSVWSVFESDLFARHGRPSWAIVLGLIAALWIAAGATRIVRERELAVLLGGFTALVAAEACALAESPTFVCVGASFAVLAVAGLFVIYQRGMQVAAVPAATIAAVVSCTVLARIFSEGVPGGMVLAVGGTLLVMLGSVGMRPRRKATAATADTDVLTGTARGAG